MRGQGATEYLVLLAVVLIIALVSIALLGFFPGMATDAKITQSNSYWRGDAVPFSIVENAIVASGAMANASLVLQSGEAGTVLTVRNITLGGKSIVWSDLPYSFAPGESHKFSGNFTPNDVPRQGMIYDFPVVIMYGSSNGVNSTQFGSKNLVGKYN
jgi:uncharacterized protein (UPF0333 family)